MGADSPQTSTTLSNLGTLYQTQGRFDEAEALFKRSLSISEKTFGPDIDTGATTNLALLYLARTDGDHASDRAEAERLLQRSLAIRENALGSDDPSVITSVNNLGYFSFLQGDWIRAYDFYKRGTDALVRLVQLGTGEAATGEIKSEAVRKGFAFLKLTKAAHKLAGANPARLSELSAATFQASQWPRSSGAAASLAQMTARAAVGLTLSGLVREQQDLVVEWRAKDKLLIASKSEAPDKRKPEAEKVLSDLLAAIGTRIGEIVATLNREFPGYAELASPKSLSIVDVQSQLSDNEALVLFLDTPELIPLPEETFIWVVTKTDSRWVRSDLGTKALQERVAALRCGLDHDGEWQWSSEKDRWTARKAACASLRPEGLMRSEALPFDLARAHEALQRPVRPGRGPDQRQAPAHRSLWRADKPAVFSARHRAGLNYASR